MAYNEELADRLREVFIEKEGFVEKKMFGGLCFLVHGNMCCGLTGDDLLMVRVGPDQYEDSLGQPHARPMDFTGRPMRGMVFVDGEGFQSESALREWVGRGMKFVNTLPHK